MLLGPTVRRCVRVAAYTNAAYGTLLVVLATISSGSLFPAHWAPSGVLAIVALHYSVAALLLHLTPRPTSDHAHSHP